MTARRSRKHRAALPRTVRGMEINDPVLSMHGDSGRSR